jgi:UDP-N-acetylglucosamine 2-epimerase (non-hydrolysing)
VPVLRVGARHTGDEVNRDVLLRLVDMFLVPGEDDAARLRSARVGPERVQVVGNPLIDAVRGSAREAIVRRAWSRAGVDPGAYVLVVLTGAAAPPTLVAPLVELSSSVPTLVELMPAVASVWRTSGALAALSRSAATIVTPERFVERLSYERGAGAIVTDSERVQEEAAVLGIRCHTLLPSSPEAATAARGATVPLGDDPWALRLVRPQLGAPTPVAIPLWDGRAAARIADIVVANFARVNYSPARS